jgi:sulfite dehydrogenase (cytochrome) subunit B
VRTKWIMAALVCLASVGTFAAEKSDMVLKEGPDAALTTGHCTACHSADYIVMNSAFLNKAGWTAEVNKMIKVMGAPIPEDQAARIVAYLTRYYGVE